MLEVSLSESFQRHAQRIEGTVGFMETLLLIQYIATSADLHRAQLMGCQLINRTNRTLINGCRTDSRLFD